MTPQPSLRTRPVGAFGATSIPVLATTLLLVMGVLFSLLHQFHVVDEVRRADARQVAAAHLLRTLVDAETGERGYFATGDPGFLDIYHRAMDGWRTDMDRLTVAADGSPVARTDVRALRFKVEGKVAEMEEARVAYERGVRNGPLAEYLRRGKVTMDEIRALLDALQPHIEEDIQQGRIRRSRVMAFGLSCAMGLVALLVVLYWLWLRQELVRVQNLQSDLAERLQFEQHLIGIVSHDLRTPLAGVLLSAQSLRRYHTLDDKAKVQVDRLIRSAERARIMISDLLDFTRARHGGLPVERKVTDLCVLVRTVVSEVRLVFPGRDLQLEDCAVTVSVDPLRVAQLVLNLVTNALTYSPPETPVRIRLECTLDNGILIQVHNVGDPIPTERLAHIFEPLQRGVDTGAGQRNIGLGLYIVHAIVQAHGGTIAVTSSRDDGTTFTVRLPAG